MSSCLCVLVHQSDFGLGSMSRSSRSSKMSFTMQINFSRLSLSSCCRSTSCPATCTHCRAVHRRITRSLWLSNFPQLSKAHIWQRVPTAQVPPDLLGGCTESTGILSHFSQSLRSHGRLAFLRAKRLSGVHGQGEDLRNHRRLGHIEGHLHVQACHKGSVISVPSWLQINTSVLLPLPVPLE